MKLHRVSTRLHSTGNKIPKESIVKRSRKHIPSDKNVKSTFFSSVKIFWFFNSILYSDVNICKILKVLRQRLYLRQVLYVHDQVSQLSCIGSVSELICGPFIILCHESRIRDPIYQLSLY